jgi:hypothetical protein
VSRRAELERAVTLYPGQRAKIAGQVAAELAVVAVDRGEITSAKDIGTQAVLVADEVLLALAAPVEEFAPEPQCGVARVNAQRVTYACRLPRGHEGDHHPNPCGHDGCTGLECRAPEKGQTAKCKCGAFTLTLAKPIEGGDGEYHATGFCRGKTP